VVQLSGTLSTVEDYTARPRICDLGYLRHTYAREDASPGYRCPSEPVEDYVKKGGTAADAAGRKCICNGLMATAGLAQRRADGSEEPAILTAGNEVAHIARFLAPGANSYSANDVIAALLT
jgi:nitronate monooxygenase